MVTNGTLDAPLGGRTVGYPRLRTLAEESEKQ
jgi:hypothetical protein